MHLSTGSAMDSWRAAMSSDTAEASYWLNWRFALCALWVLASVAASSVLIWRFECFGSPGGEENRDGKIGVLYEDEPWRPCLRTIHPVWLLIFRVFAFCLFLMLIVVNALANGASILYYYTEWTFMLVTIYFGLGLLLSAYGCRQYTSEAYGHRIVRTKLNPEGGLDLAPTSGEIANGSHAMRNSAIEEGSNNRRTAGFAGYLFQIIYQTNAGAVLLTDFVFWLIIFPVLSMNDYGLSFLQVGMHSINVVFLLGDAALNSLRFPWFRAAYFLLWTSIYVIFQWILHACVSIEWPYPFLDLSSVHSPIWYFILAVLHVPVYAVFHLLVKMKHSLLMRWFPQSYYLAS
ncbi:hypothetical protein KSP39_PZI006452 [Platanthera zijinensis]|uniref:Uncharacterized protein n=1 Tax=Platanthera zijinensis TaxID=2320716 RepID=A0AAP0BPI3_9ASPA